MSTARAQAKEDIYAGKNVREVMARVFRWQVTNPVQINLRNENLWARAAFYAGVMSARTVTPPGTSYNGASVFTASSAPRVASLSVRTRSRMPSGGTRRTR